MRAYNFSTVIFLYLALAFFAVPHLIDDFLFDIPAEFGLSIHVTQVLAGIFIVIYLAIMIPLARGKKIGLYSAIGMGGFLALAGILKHLAPILKPEPYWSGWFSEALIIGMILTGLAVILTGIFAVKNKIVRRKMPY